jgi:hypothetical protein
MRLKPTDKHSLLKIEQSICYPNHVYLLAPDCHLTPAEARRVAAALVKEAGKAERRVK